MLNLKGLQNAIGSALCGAALLLPISAVSDSFPHTKPEKHGVSSERLSRIETHMDKALLRREMVGGLGLLARNGEIIYLKGYGQADDSPARPMSPDTLFRIYSMSKPITSVAVLMLYEEGHFKLNDPIARYLPELANLHVALSTSDETSVNAVHDGTDIRSADKQTASEKAGKTREALRQPTIRDLLAHTSGLTYGLLGDSEVDNLYRTAGIGLMSTLSLEEMVKRLGTLPLQYDPGTRWHYSVATDVLGRLVEVVSGQSLDEFMQERIFQPLGMKDTGFTLKESDKSRLAQLYSPPSVDENDPESLLRGMMNPALVEAKPTWDEMYRPDAAFKSGGGGLLSTIADYLRFCQMLLNGGELNDVRLLSPKTVELMTSNHLTGTGDVFARGGTGFGLGVAVSLNQAAFGELGSTGEYNWGGAAGTKFWIDPQEKLIGIFMTQSIPHASQIGLDFKYLSYQAITDSYTDNVPPKKRRFW